MADVNISKYRASVVRDGSKPASPGFVVSEGQDPVNPPGTNNFVPYTGATANVELGEFGVEAGFVTLDTTPTNIPTDQGAIYWDDTRSTAALIMNGTLQHIGQDSFFYVKNSSGSTIPKGTCVGFAGTEGASGHLLITPFLANGSVPSTYFMGVTCESIANGSFGQVMHFGELTGINTSGFTAGALLYASSTVAGAFQTTAPVAPNNIILVAAAVNSKNNGAIVVRPTLGSNINSDEGVKITSPTTGDLLQLQAGGLWENKTLAQVIGSAYVPSTRTLTINGTAFDLSANRSWTVGDVRTDGSYSNPSWITALAWSKITGTPTTLSGYGITDAVPSSRTITINGVTQDLSANRTFNVGTVTSVGLSSATSGVTIGSTPITSSGTITLAIATASGSQQGLLSASDWTTFNNKQNALTNPVTGTGTTNYLAKFTGSTTVGNSQIFDNGTNVGIGTASPSSYGGTGLTIQSSTTSNIASLVLRNSDNSVRGHIYTSGSGNSLIVGSATSSNLQLVTADTVRATIDTLGNLGLGVTPSAWNSIFKVIQLQDANIFTFSGNPGLQFTTNAYFDTGFKYQRTAGATYYVMAPDSHRWHIAPSGTAGNAISFTQAMTLTSGGNLLVGTTSDNGERLQVNGEITAVTRIRINKTTQTNQLFGDGNAFTGGTSGDLGIRNDSGRILFASGGGTIQMLLNSNGNVGIGTSNPQEPLHISTSGADKFIRIENSNSYTGIWMNDSGANNGWLLMSGYTNTTSPGDFAIREYGVQTSLVIKQSSGNVLIGTTSDNGARLQVSGAIYASDELYLDNGKYLRFRRSSGNLSIQTLGIPSGTDDVRLLTTGDFNVLNGSLTNLMTVKNGGNVGIGTTTFAYSPRLAVASVGQNSIAIQTTDTVQGSAGTILYLGTGASTGNSTFGIIRALGNGGTGATNLVLQESGNVLIGTTTDNGARLQVSGIVNSRSASTSAGLGQVAFIGSGEFMSTGSLSGYFWENRSGGVTSNSNWYGWYTTSGVINLWNGGGNLLSINGTSGAATFSSSVTAGKITTSGAASLPSSSALSEAILLIQDSGSNRRLGIGSSTSGQWIQSSYPGVDGISSTLLLNPSGGNVGIGTTAPSQRLEVAGVTRSESLNVYGSTNPASTSPYLYSPSTGALGFGGNGAERIRITSDGTLGFNGSSSPGNAGLDKMSMGYLNGNYGWIQTWNSTPLIINPLGNNVLIGTTTDVGARLHVAGDIRTQAPTGGSAVNWRLGTVRGGTITPNATVRVEIGGVLVDLDARYV